jgi:prepilin-type N-terminal cleavage/methylation domain-containing protein/prepilin-type processing-associated H-X9-DG protein
MKRNAGFSLVEFIVVLAIIALLLTLLLPVLLRGREAARRVQCVNNLKQMALALQSYQASNNVLPSGCYDVGSDADGGVGRMSWFTSILPYSEQYGVFSAIDFDRGALDVGNRTVRNTQMSMLLCPNTDRWSRHWPMFPPWSPPASSPEEVAVSSYAGCHHDVEAPIAADNHGMFFRNSRIRAIDVTDGLSQTLLIGEVAHPSAFGWMSGSRATLRNTGHPINGVTADAFGKAGPPPSLKDGGMTAEALERMVEVDESTVPPGFVGGFGSRHGAGANFAFGDGSVRFLVETIDPGVLRLLGHRSDGEAIDDSSY